MRWNLFCSISQFSAGSIGVVMVHSLRCSAVVRVVATPSRAHALDLGHGPLVLRLVPLENVAGLLAEALDSQRETVSSLGVLSSGHGLSLPDRCAAAWLRESSTAAIRASSDLLAWWWTPWSYVCPTGNHGPRTPQEQNHANAGPGRPAVSEYS